MQRIFSLFLALLLLSCGSTRPVLQANAIDPYRFTSNKKVVAEKGAVVSAHPLASEVGLAMLKAGGNAFDAAIATQLALAVVYPNAGNLGGGGFLVAALPDGRQLALDYREMAPSAAHRDMYLDAGGKVKPGRSVNGHLSSGVPGTVAGLFATLPYARLSMKKLIQPAIELAEKGFVLTRREAASLNGIQKDLNEYNTMPTAFQRRSGWKEGDTLVQPDLAATLRRIRDGGQKGFYTGITARLIVEEMKRGGGIISLEDLASYQAKWRKPHTFAYKGHTIVSMPPPSSGGVLLHQMLKMVEKRPLADYGFHSANAVQLMTEVERLAYADRAEHLGDPDFYAVPLAGLVEENYLAERMSRYKQGKAGVSRQITPGKPRRESEETTHLSILDAEGNAVAVTTTLNNSFGSKTVVGAAGFLLNDEMDDFSVKPGEPNMYGAVGGEANAIAPGKRMLSSMTPTLVLKEGKPFLVIGTPGGTTIITSVFQTIVNIIDFNLSTEDAVNKPKFHHQWLPDELFVETGFPDDVRKALQNMGYTVIPRGAIGRTEVIRVVNGRMEAVADHRGDDSAAGW
jgi:gamma-glutamyltranspeptidase/glutathione hydrolase